MSCAWRLIEQTLIMYTVLTFVLWCVPFLFTDKEARKNSIYHDIDVTYRTWLIENNIQKQND